MYKVQGLPDSLSARIAEMHGRWQILVQRNHVGRWTGSYKNPEEALVGIAQELNLN